MRILVIEREPEGECPKLPALYLFSDEDKKEKMRFSPEEEKLIEASNFHPFQAFYHRGAHSGVAADYICDKWGSHMTCLRSCDEDDDDDDENDERDNLLEDETKKADVILESLTVSFGDSNMLYEDMHDYIEHIKEILKGKTYITKNRKRDLKNAGKNELITFFEKNTLQQLMKFFFPYDDGDDESE